MLPTYAQCLRDGVFKETPVRDLVKGDIVFVKSGEVIPADMRVIASKGFKVRYIDQFYRIISTFILTTYRFEIFTLYTYLQVDNSSLTGESVAVSRSNTEGHSNILESQNVAFFSTLCVEGWAKGT